MYGGAGVSTERMGHKGIYMYMHTGIWDIVQCFR